MIYAIIIYRHITWYAIIIYEIDAPLFCLILQLRERHYPSWVFHCYYSCFSFSSHYHTYFIIGEDIEMFQTFCSFLPFLHYCLPSFHFFLPLLLHTENRGMNQSSIGTEHMEQHRRQHIRSECLNHRQSFLEVFFLLSVNYFLFFIHDREEKFFFFSSSFERCLFTIFTPKPLSFSSAIFTFWHDADDLLWDEESP